MHSSYTVCKRMLMTHAIAGLRLVIRLASLTGNWCENKKHLLNVIEHSP